MQKRPIAHWTGQHRIRQRVALRRTAAQRTAFDQAEKLLSPIGLEPGKGNRNSKRCLGAASQHDLE
jgi:hypothetical protein